VTTTFATSTYRSNFIAGWDRYVERGWMTHPPADVYWNPRQGQWQTYATGQWRFVDENLPRIDKVDFMTNAGDVFDQITQQWSAIPSRQQQLAVWDGRQHKWIEAEHTGDGNCRQLYEERLAYLRQLHSSGQLSDELFEKQAKDLWREYEHCI
jgi:hypothetical protein